MATPKKTAAKKFLHDGYAYYYERAEHYDIAVKQNKELNKLTLMQCAVAVVHLRENRIVKFRYDMEKLLDNLYNV